MSQSDWDELIELLDEAYDQDMGRVMRDLTSTTHVLARLEGELVGHACWVTRWLQVGNDSPLRTAYVEAVATGPRVQRQGIGSAIMSRVRSEIDSSELFELAALCAGPVVFYEKLDWRLWRGDLFVRTPAGLTRTHEKEDVMIFPTPRSPALDLDSVLSAEWRPGEVW